MMSARSDTGHYTLAVIGASAGGAVVLRALLSRLPEAFCLPVAIAQHVSKAADGSWAELLNSRCAIQVKEAEDKEPLSHGTAYLAPANYHLLIEAEGVFTLTIDEPVNYARPSIDVLFETAADAYANRVVAILLTGANSDGALGLKAIHDAGGLVIVQDPATADAQNMPRAGIAQVPDALVMHPAAIADTLIALHQQQHSRPL